MTKRPILIFGSYSLDICMCMCLLASVPPCLSVVLFVCMLTSRILRSLTLDRVFILYFSTFLKERARRDCVFLR